MDSSSRAEGAFAAIAASGGLPEPEREYEFAPPRRWRFDFAWPVGRVAVEVEGIHRAGGGTRHQRGRGFMADAEKYLAAQVLGWVVVRVPAPWLSTWQYHAQVQQVLAVIRSRLSATE